MATKIIATLVRDGVAYASTYDRDSGDCEWTIDGIVVEDLPGPTIQRQSDGTFSRGYAGYVSNVLREAIDQELLRLSRLPRSERAGVFSVAAHEVLV
jgi:hypothetical protein